MGAGSCPGAAARRAPPGAKCALTLTYACAPRRSSRSHPYPTSTLWARTQALVARGQDRGVELPVAGEGHHQLRRAWAGGPRLLEY